MEYVRSSFVLQLIYNHQNTNRTCCNSNVGHCDKGAWQTQLIEISCLLSSIRSGNSSKICVRCMRRIRLCALIISAGGRRIETMSTQGVSQTYTYSNH